MAVSNSNLSLSEARLCPHCGSSAVLARERLFADRTGRIRGDDYRCRDCSGEFVLLR
jgi:hypothetical protein